MEFRRLHREMEAGRKEREEKKRVLRVYQDWRRLVRGVVRASTYRL